MLAKCHSLDVRRGRSGRHWWNEERFGRRVRFLLPQATLPASGLFTRNASTTALARLQIANVTRQDGGDYRCRVDFNSAPSRNFKYRLIVIGESNLFTLFLVIIILPHYSCTSHFRCYLFKTKQHPFGLHVCGYKTVWDISFQTTERSTSSPSTENSSCGKISTFY